MDASYYETLADKMQNNTADLGAIDHQLADGCD